MENFLIQYGLIAVLFCATIENDVTFILTGVVVELGIVHPIPGLIYGVAGALIHDSLIFWFGHWRAESIRNTQVYRRVGPLIERMAANFGPWELFYCRFIYGTRNPSLIFWGTQRLDYFRFLFIDGLALTIWGSFLTALGYFLSDRAGAIIGRMKSMEHWLLCALVFIAIAVFSVRAFMRHEIKKRLPLPAPAPEPNDETSE